MLVDGRPLFTAASVYSPWERYEGALRLIRTKATPSAPTRTSEWVALLPAVRSGASQVLLVFDTCFSGQGVMEAAAVVGRLGAACQTGPAWVPLVA